MTQNYKRDHSGFYPPPKSKKSVIRVSLSLVKFQQINEDAERWNKLPKKFQEYVNKGKHIGLSKEELAKILIRMRDEEEEDEF